MVGLGGPREQTVREIAFEMLGNACGKCGYKAEDGYIDALSARLRTQGDPAGSTGRPLGINFDKYMSMVMMSAAKKDNRYVLWCLNCVHVYGAKLKVSEAARASLAPRTRVWVSPHKFAETLGWNSQHLNKCLEAGEQVVFVVQGDSRVYRYLGDGTPLANDLEAFCEQYGLVYRSVSSGDGAGNVLEPRALSAE